VIAELQGLINTVNGSTSHLNGLLNLLLGSVLTATNGIINKGNDLRPAAQALLNTIASARTQAINLQAALSALGDISLCNLDLSVLLDFRRRVNLLKTDNPTGLYATLNGAINSSNIDNVLSQFGGVANVNCGLLGLNCVLNSVLGNLLVSTNNLLASSEPTLKSLLTTLNTTTLTQISQTITQLAADIAEFANSATSPTRKSSKRVVVAVVLDPAGPVGPNAPIWMSTVVTDPKAGLLG
jgi:hypothetical protein